MLNRYLLLLSLLMAGASSAHAQAQAESLQSASFKQRLRAQYLHNDTAQAIINLYGKRQGGGASWIVAAALSATKGLGSGPASYHRPKPWSAACSPRPCRPRTTCPRPPFSPWIPAAWMPSWRG